MIYFVKQLFKNATHLKYSGPTGTVAAPWGQWPHLGDSGRPSGTVLGPADRQGTQVLAELSASCPCLYPNTLGPLDTGRWSH